MKDIAIAAMVCALAAALLVESFHWTQLSELRQRWSTGKAVAFAQELSRDHLWPTCHGSEFSYDLDCSVIVDTRPVFFHCDDSGCEPKCGGNK